jgi:Txe/YoeB family toxin of Txe-Axe toxin-antitoxin module
MAWLTCEAGEAGIDAEQVRSFYSHNWKRRIALEVEDFYLWQFTACPESCGKDKSVVVIDSETREIGSIMGLNPRPFYLNGVKHEGAELTTWISRSDLQGKGLGPKIIKFIQDKYEVFIGMGISNDALPIYMRMGARYLKRIPRFVKLIKPEMASAVAELQPLALKLHKTWSQAPKSEKPIIYEATPDDIEKAWSFQKGIHACFSRDFDHFQWRYTNHPKFRYNAYLIKSSQCINPTVIVTRHTAINGIGSVLHIVDVIGDPLNLKTALDWIDIFDQEGDLIAADIYCTSEKLSSICRCSGWFSVNDDDCIKFPHLFSPLELREPQTTSLIYWSRNNMAEISSMCTLSVTKSDCDLDRPTLNDY